jgi:hypothetical protein
MQQHVTKTTSTKQGESPTGEALKLKLTRRPWLLALSVVLLLAWFGFLISMAVR